MDTILFIPAWKTTEKQMEFFFQTAMQWVSVNGLACSELDANVFPPQYGFAKRLARFNKLRLLQRARSFYMRLFFLTKISFAVCY